MKKLAIFFAALFGASGAWAQTDTAYVPFVVNVNATVGAMLLQGVAPCGSPSPQISVAANTQAILRIPLQDGEYVGVRYGAQKALTAPAIVSNGAGKVTLNLPAQSYKNAEIALYSVNGKRMLRQKASAANTANSISLPNAAPGAYLLSVKGADGGGFTSRLTHNGGNLAITVAFGGENRPAAARQLAKEAAVPCIWRITVGEAAGYADTSYWFNPVSGWSNPVQEIYLRYAGSVVTPGDSGTPSGMYSVSVSSVGIGATGSGSYAAGATVSISAGTAPAGQQFKNWTATSGGVTFYNANSATTSFTMPANAVTVTAVFGAASVLSAPANVTATGTSETSITVSWSAVSGAERYSVFRSTAAAGANFPQITCPSSTTITNGGLSAGKTYYYKVSALSGGGVDWDGLSDGYCPYGDNVVESPQSPYVSATTYPSTPAGVAATATAQSPSSIIVSWSAVTGATGYYVYRSASVAGTYTKVGDVTSTSTSYTNTGLSTGTTYYYKVSAYNGSSGSESALSSYASAAAVEVIFGTFIDYRDEKTYKYVTIIDKRWMAENLNYNTTSSWCYENSPDNCAKYGRLYDWSTARTVCPIGWHLPTNREWGDLAIAAGGTGTYGTGGTAGKALKSTSGWRGTNGNGTDTYGFNALPGGIRITDGSFDYAGSYGLWWTATASGGGRAYPRYMRYDNDNVGENEYGVGYGLSVRCVGD